MPTRTEAIANFLKAKSPFGHLYTKHMEVQVNVAQDAGSPVEGEYKGRQWRGYTDGATTWKSFRIPWNAATEPTYQDTTINFDLEMHAEGIGMTGWDWGAKVSKWVAFDFDAIVGHSDKHASKLSAETLAEVRAAATNIPWVTVRRSTGGNGLHLYVFVDNVITRNHNEHAALGRSILGMMTMLTGFNFKAHVDVCGSNMWVWHRKMKDNSFELLKPGEVLREVPADWRDHVDVISGKAKKSRPIVTGHPGFEFEPFEELASQYIRHRITDEHKKHIEWLRENGYVVYYNPDHHIVVTHTHGLRAMHKDLNLKGFFETDTDGTEKGHQNCFMFPRQNGAWDVRRFSRGVKEHPTWQQDGQNWTKCLLNSDPDFRSACKAHGGIEHPAGGYAFENVDMAVQAANKINANVIISNVFLARKARLKLHKDGRLIFEFEAEDNDKVEGWLKLKNNWQRIFDVRAEQNEELSTRNYDNVIRHLISESDADQGWVIRSDGQWRSEPLRHATASLKALGENPKNIELVVGGCIHHPWKLVNKPFQPEYLPNREWNRGAAQLRYAPSQNDNLHYPSWNKILNHIGATLNDAVANNPWCKINGINSGADYLKCWVAAVLQHPHEPLPYLFLWGPQNSGKSIFHEALSLIIDRGVNRADNALTNTSAFNGEIENAVICVVEETDLKRNKLAYNRIKDWVTSRQIPIHRKFDTPYTVPNTTHWIQCSNDSSAVPIFPGDTRIVMVLVNELDFTQTIPKRVLVQELQKEAPDFIAALLQLEIPESKDRLLIPVIETQERIDAEKANQSALESFIDDMCVYAPGEVITLADFWVRYSEWLDPNERHDWTKRRIGKELPAKFPKGRSPKDNHVIIGNIAFKPHEVKPNARKLVLHGELLVPG